MADIETREAKSILAADSACGQKSTGNSIRVLTLRSVTGTGGGAEEIVLRNATSVDPARIAMKVCCIRSANDDAFDFDRRAAVLGIDYCEVLQRHPLDRKVLPALRQIIRTHQVAIVHAHDYKSIFFAQRLARVEGITPLATVHGWTGHHVRERYLYYPAERILLRSFPKVIAVSSQIRDTLVRWGANSPNVHVVLNGIDTTHYRRDESIAVRARQRLGLQPGDVVLGAAGRLEPQKRFDVLIDTFARLLPRHPELRLLIAGEGSLQRDLRRQIDRLRLGHCCRLLGHCPDMIETYHAFDLLVQSSDYEGTPTVVVEAMGLGIPVVATDVGGTAELIRDKEDGLITVRRNPAALAAAIEESLADRAATQRRVLSAHARVAQELSLESRTAKLERIYEQLAMLRFATTRE